MNSPSRTRAIVLAGALAGAASFAAAPPATAAPKPAPVVRAHSASRCEDLAALAARLRAAGLTAQAAHIAAILTVRNCR